MPVFIVERYLPGMSKDSVVAAAARTEDATTAMVTEGIELRYLLCTFVPGEESVLCMFESPSAIEIEEVNRRAAFPLHRIVEAVRVPVTREE